MESIVNIGITLAMIMVGLAIVLAVVLPLIKQRCRFRHFHVVVH